MLEQLLLLSAVASAFLLARLIRRFDPAQRGYVMIVGGVLTVSLMSVVQGDRFLGVIAVSMCVLTVVLPSVLEVTARVAFGRGRMGLAVRLAGARAVLMPGAGLSRQQEILSGLAVLERAGVDAALEHFRGLAGETEDGGELAVIHEQIVSMLFYGHRWDEGIAHYEDRFHPGYAAVRPALALGLLRAYGESGRLNMAAGLLRALEEGPIGADPRAVALLCQARVTFLAYAGEAAVVDGALKDEHLPLLGMSRASGALFRGIAHARAGEPERARTELVGVEQLAGPADRRVLEASQTALAGMSMAMQDAVQLAPDLRSYAATVADKVQRFLAGAPVVRRAGNLVATPALVAAVLVGYLAFVLVDRSGTGLLIVGAMMPELWDAGSWGRLFTGFFVHGDVAALLLTLYALWLGGPVIERLRGSSRLFVVAFAAGIAGCATSGSLAHPASVIAGGNLMSFGVAFAALWLLFPFHTPALAARSRRTLAIPLLLVLVAHGLVLVSSITALDLPPLGMAVAGAAAALVVAIPPEPRILRPIPVVLTAVIGFVTALAVVKVAREDVDAFLAQREKPMVEDRNVKLVLPVTFVPVAAGRGNMLPIYDGFVDGLQARVKKVVQVIVVDREGVAADVPGILVVDPELVRDLDVVDDDRSGQWWSSLREDGTRSWILRRNGEMVARVLERNVGADRSVLLLAAPPNALDAAPQVYAAVLRDSARIEHTPAAVDAVW